MSWHARLTTLLVLLSIAPFARPAVADGPLVQISGFSPFGPGCAGPQPGYNYLNSEVEPWLAVNPTNPNNLIGIWQQDRWDNGGATSLATAVSTNGGVSWVLGIIPSISLCSGASDYQRATDPWLSFAPNGTLHGTSFSLNRTDATSAMLALKSTDGGFTWSAPLTLIRDTKPGTLNDKETITADPNDPSYVYAVWDRLKTPPGENAGGRSVENARSFIGPTMLARSTDGGATWEPARVIFDPGPLGQTVGNQIAVLPSGELINVMDVLQSDNSKKGRGESAAILRSTDRGLTWSKPIVIAKMFPNYGLLEPTSGTPVRAGQALPGIAVDRSNGRLYVAWEDARFGTEGISFSMSTDGGFTWSSPILISKSPAGVPAFVPAIAINSAGTVGITYYDFRNNSGLGGAVPGGTDHFLATCDGGCDSPANWHEKRVTPASFDLRYAPFASTGLFLGDYDGLAAAGTDFLALFAMSNGGDPASIFFRRMTPAAAIAAEPDVAERAPAAAPGAAAPSLPSLAITGLRPNPATGGRVTVEFTLPTSAPARLELLDIAGRRLADRNVASLGAGRHTLDLAAGRRVPPGLYLVRLLQGERMVSTHAVVLE